MQYEEIKDLTVEELRRRVKSERELLFEAKMKHSLGQINSPIEIRSRRRFVAQMLTALNSKVRK